MDINTCSNLVEANRVFHLICGWNVLFENCRVSTTKSPIVFGTVSNPLNVGFVEKFGTQNQLVHHHPKFLTLRLPDMGVAPIHFHIGCTLWGYTMDGGIPIFWG